MQPKINLIFGVTGQVGSYLAELCLSKGEEVLGVARRTSTSNKSRISHLLLNRNFELRGGDVTDITSIQRILSSIVDKYYDIHIYNLAAQSHVAVSFEQPSTTWDITAKGVMNILDAVCAYRHEYKFGKFRFLQMSSSEMFGKEMDNDGFQRETTRFRPCSPYGVAKLAAHELVNVYRESYGLPACCAIAFNNESPRRGEEFVTRKITKYVSKIPEFLKSRPPLELGNCTAHRDWCYSGDTVKAIYLMMNKQFPLKDYVIASGESHSVLEFLYNAFDCVGIKHLESKEYFKVTNALYRPCEVPYLRGDASLIKKDLGWSPEVSFQSLIKMMIEADALCQQK